jgi:hypothetical protein
MNGDDSEAKGGREGSALFNVEQNRGLCPAVVFGAGLLFAAMPFRGTPTVSTRNSREDEESVDKGARFENWIVIKKSDLVILLNFVKFSKI